ncbi:hypothetical protein SEUCBS139899_008191 [Sporothrix eucalyptigena]
MTTPTPITSSFKVTPPTIEADDHVVYHGRDSVAIFSARLDGVQLDSLLNYSCTTLLVYAETIYLQSKEIKLPGKHIGLFCNKLVLSLEDACIDVSGEPGKNSTAQATGGTGGGDGGAVWLYVEEPSPTLRKHLRIRAYGGDGGHGAGGDAGTEPGVGNGSKGGDGGACGQISCYVGSTAFRYAQRLVGLSDKKTWAGWVAEAGKSLDTDVAALLACGVHEPSVKTWQAAVGGTVSMLEATTTLQTALSDLLKVTQDRPLPGKETTEATKQLLDTLTQYRSTEGGPRLAEDATETTEGLEQRNTELAQMKALVKQCSLFYGGAQKEKKLKEAMDAVRAVLVAEMTATAEKTHRLDDILSAFLDALRSAMMNEPMALASEVCALAGGRGGPGGSGRTAQDASGARGADKPSNKSHTQLVSLSTAGNKMDCRMVQAVVAPEQCQMLLDQADRLYFTGDLLQYPLAMRLYTKLTQRLGFVEAMRADKSATNNLRTSPLAVALAGLEVRYALTTDTLQQLDRIYTTALRRLSGIGLNQDLWGRTSTWVPRLSLAYYGTRVDTMIARLAEVEAMFKEYAEAHQRQMITDKQLEHVQTSNGAMATAAKTQIDSILEAGGELEQAADAIELCRPRLVAARAALSSSLAAMQEAIRTQFHVSPDSVMEALSMLSMAPEGFAAVVQAADVAYKAETKVEDARGNLVKKSYVLHQIGTCTGSLASLTDTFATMKKGDLSDDDPGYAKIFATASDIEDILKDFTERVPDAAGAVRKQLDAFLAAATKRNGHVLHYNGLLDQLQKLEGIQRQCAAEAERLGDRLLGQSPALPAIYFWLKTLKRESILRIMQELNNQARAQAFWGPTPVSSVTFSPPGPKDGAVQLRLHQEELAGRFEKAYEGFQSNGWHFFPTEKSFEKEGIRIPLTASALASLKDTNEALITVTPRAHTDFLDMANARVTQVRFWLLGATVSAHDPGAKNPRYPLRVQITQCGDDTLWTAAGKPCIFRHAPVTVQFSYETTLFNATQQCSGKPELVYGTQEIEHDYAGGPRVPGASDKPPIGPFGDWKVVVRKDVNPDLDLTGVTAGWIEFCGRHQAATALLQGLD